MFAPLERSDAPRRHAACSSLHVRPCPTQEQCRPSGLWYILAFAAAANAGPSCSANDFMGPSLVGYPLPLPYGGAVGIAQCEALCAVDPRCAAWSFVPTGCEGNPGPTCTLRSAAGQPNATASCACSALASATSQPAPPADAKTASLTSAYVNASVGSRGLLSLSFGPPHSAGPIAYDVLQDSWALALDDGVLINSTQLSNATTSAQPDPQSAVLQWLIPTPGCKYTVTVSFTVRDTWAYVRKGITISSDAGNVSIVAVSPWDTLLLKDGAPTSTPRALTSVLYSFSAMGGNGAFLRFSDNTGLLLGLTNSFVDAVVTRDGSSGQPTVFAHASYASAMANWSFTTERRPSSLAFECDAGFIAAYPLTHNYVPLAPIWAPSPASSGSAFLTRDGTIAPHNADEVVAVDRHGRARVERVDFPSANGSWTWAHGYLATGYDAAPPANTTVDAALDACEALDACVAVTFASPTGDPAPAGFVLAYFKSEAFFVVSATWVTFFREDDTGAMLDYAERDALRAAAETHYLLPPTVTVKINVGWTENDQTVDISNSSIVEYERIIAMANAIGLTHILAAPQNTNVSSYVNATDWWGFEEILWFSLGIAQRQGEWAPPDALPHEVAAFLQLAGNTGNASSAVNLVPYIYPILGWHSADPSWRQDPTNLDSFCTLDHQGFQEFLTDAITAFQASTGARGAGFDFTYLISPTASNYAQWRGWRRVLTDIRLAANASAARSGSTVPFAVDSRQANHQWGPWMWAAGSYAEPLQSDEQPESWQEVVPEPKTDRASADHLRRMGWLYSQTQFCPPSAMPGFAHHQTDRYYANGYYPRAGDFNLRDYDYFGAPYSLLSSIAVGGLNSVICDIPARDEQEFLAFPADGAAEDEMSVAFYRRWFAWADAHMDHLRAAKYLPVAPATLNGGVDGVYMFPISTPNSGFLFMFNADTSANMSMPVHLSPATDIYCTPGADAFALTEVWPLPRALGTYACGSNFTVAAEGRSATVYSLDPVSAPDARFLFAAGRAARRATSVEFDASIGQLRVSGWADHDSTLSAGCAIAPMYVQLPMRLLPALTSAQAESSRPGSAQERGLVPVRFTVLGDNHRGGGRVPHACPPGTASPPDALPSHAVVALHLSAVGPTFVRSQAVTGMGYDPIFAGGALTGTVNVPAPVFAQLAARAASFPVPWTADDLAISWLAPARLLAFIDDGRVFWSAKNNATLTATLDGVPIPVLPSWNCRSRQDPTSGCWNGFFLDLTGAGATAGRDFALVLHVPPIPTGSLGAFRGVYYENVNTVYTSSAAEE